MDDLRVLSFNVRGLRDFGKRSRIFSYIKKFKADVILIQEAHVLESDINSWKLSWGQGDMYINPFTERSAGQIIMLNEKYKVLSHEIIEQGRCHLLCFKKQEVIVNIINIYAPNKDLEQVEFYKLLQTKLNLMHLKGVTIIGGDFNLAPCQTKDRSPPTRYTKLSRKILYEIINDENLIDIWRKTHPNKRKFTWRQNNPKIKSRLDYFLIKQDLESNVKSCEIIPGISSDHEMVEIYLKLNSNVRGPGLWKFNNSLLDDTEFKSEMKNLINRVWEENSNIRDLGVRFDYLKYEIMKFSRALSIKKAKERRKIEFDLLEKIKEIDEKIKKSI